MDTGVKERRQPLVRARRGSYFGHSRARFAPKSPALPFLPPLGNHGTFNNAQGLFTFTAAVALENNYDRRERTRAWNANLTVA